MQYRTDAKSGNQLPVLGFGCMRFPGTIGNTDMKKTEELIQQAVQGGVNFFDTAYLYPGSEIALGTVLEKLNLRNDVFISTKLPLFKCHSYADFDKYLDAQLSRLKTTYIDYYFMHNMTKFADWQRLCALGIEGWLAHKKEQGVIRQVGFSFHGQKDAFTQLLDAYDWEFCMIQYNYVNVNYQAGAAGLERAHAKGIPVFIMEPLLGGRLANGLPAAALQKLDAHSPGSTPASWALRWLWNHPQITMVLSGMNSMQQLKENIKIASATPAGSMAGEEIDVVEQVAQIFAESYKVPCTGCNYCLPCPAKINIPDSFMAYNASYTMGRFTGIQLYATTSGGFEKAFAISDCTACGKCSKLCPQEIDIVARLGDVRKRMEPWWYRAGMAIARKFV